MQIIQYITANMIQHLQVPLAYFTLTNQRPHPSSNCIIIWQIKRRRRAVSWFMEEVLFKILFVLNFQKSFIIYIYLCSAKYFQKSNFKKQLPFNNIIFCLQFLKIKPNSVRIIIQSCQFFVLPSTGFELSPLIHYSTILLALRPASQTTRPHPPPGYIIYY